MGGGATKCPYKKKPGGGAGNVLAMLKCFCKLGERGEGGGGGGGHTQSFPRLEEGGYNKFRTCNFPIL